MLKSISYGFRSMWGFVWFYSLEFDVDTPDSHFFGFVERIGKSKGRLLVVEVNHSVEFLVHPKIRRLRRNNYQQRSCCFDETLFVR